MSTLLMAAGIVLIVEGLVFALAPSRVEDILRMLAALPLEARRLLGLIALAGGTFLIFLARYLSGL
ncbi:DUF2065 domain-containing protein [Pseudoruegeria sp. SK021]|uniref:DUF2065 domain-containing protein n=1 Tax=Pseudoruegeria sp. SK021 TaxID=1933035 RepID=UPI000A239A31|nr:DUF2065 domain-containing protein [Pseudoruegeria sp. SK021]OSP56697.1 hypothetical protein BV911_01735 [Pseudoruegeria sp. SK021]